MIAQGRRDGLLCGALGGCDGFGVEDGIGEGKEKGKGKGRIVLRSFPFVCTVLISRHEFLG